jgi:aarF domain-containing kinase
MPTVAQLIDALPLDHDEPAHPGAPAPVTTPGSMRPVPVGRLRRIGILGSLQAKIAAAHLFYWVRGLTVSADEKERLLSERRLRDAARLLDSMNYLRGAAVKLGQTLATIPHVVPDQVAAMLDQLHFNALPMHYSLVREMVYNELGDDPENLFASFEPRAFAAASIGQVHCARLTTGDPVVLKIQYPGIGRAIAADFRNLYLLLFAARFRTGWETMRLQLDDIRTRLERETDYAQEARTQQTVRALFRDDEGIVVPRIHPQWSTTRVLTMDRLDGLHLPDFLATAPSQDLRNAFAAKILRAHYRMYYTARLAYVDFNPGNFLFMPGGRLGLLDFGCMVESDPDLMRKSNRAATSGNRNDRLELVKTWVTPVDGADDQERIDVMEKYIDWAWRPRYCGGPYDYGDEAEFRRGVDLWNQVRRTRGGTNRASTPMLVRQHWTLRVLLKRLAANLDVAPIADDEARKVGLGRDAQ